MKKDTFVDVCGPVILRDMQVKMKTRFLKGALIMLPGYNYPHL